MKTRLLLFILLAFIAIKAKGQNTPDNFEKFAGKQDSLMMLDYKERNVKSYSMHLKELLAGYDKLSEDDKDNNNNFIVNAYYNFACTYSILNRKHKAIKYLHKAVDRGYSSYSHLLEDSDMNNIRNEKDFKVVSAYLRNTGDFLYILKRAARYNKADNRPLPEFTYQAPDDPRLTELRKAFNLDSIAGKGEEASRILNLMRWVHNLIPHDGTHGNPKVQNALSMITECRRDKRGLNCRGLAMALNECYLSLGIKSRIVTCLPKDSLKKDQDCHVINMVYSETLKKWLWIDPTNDAYVMNEKGELLSIEEVRERLIHDQPLVLNRDANWNNKMSTKQEEYLYHYMAKNLYILECPASSQYNLETREPGRVYTYIKLLPLEYFSQTPDKKEEKDTKNNTTWINYKTNNAEIFWKAPGGGKM